MGSPSSLTSIDYKVSGGEQEYGGVGVGLVGEGLQRVHPRGYGGVGGGGTRDILWTVGGVHRGL